MTRLQALQYIRNTAGNATVANFVEDWEPVGGIEWDLLTRQYLAQEKDGKIYLTDRGEQRLAELEKA